jgi:hypothetical protein
MIEIDYIESLIGKFYRKEKNLDLDKIDLYLKEEHFILDQKSLEDRILKFKKKNGIDL